MRVNVLCGCGWGRLAIPEEDVPEFCPVCGFRLWDQAGRESEDDLPVTRNHESDD
jgi:hypothetical protein